MSKYYKAEDVMEIFSDESRPENWMGTETEIQEQVDFDFYKSQIESLPTIEVSEDCISREYILRKVYDMDNDDLVVDIKDIEDAPSVVPSRAEGEWENYKDEHRCSECGEVVIGDWYDDEWYDYCPNCGAKMKG